jgi:hypothetical protein
MDVLNFNDFLNEKRVVIKRKYTESYPAKKLSTYAKVRNQVFSALQNGMLSEEEFLNVLSSTNAHNRWFKRNSRFFVVKEETGTKKIGLSSYGHKVMTKTLNENLEPGNIQGMGPVELPGDPNTLNSFNGQKDGSGDIPFLLKKKKKKLISFSDFLKNQNM